MRIKLYIPYLFFMTGLFLSCSSKSGLHVDNNGVDTINLDNASQRDSILLSTIVDEPEVIILETKDNCIIREIRAMEVCDNRIYILDDLSSSMLVFSRDGSFVSKIGERGRGHGEYLELADFSIDRENNVIYLWDETLNTVFIYDIQTKKYISEIEIKNNNAKSFCLLYFDNHLYLNRTSKNDDDKGFDIIKIDLKTRQQCASYLNSEEYNNGWKYPMRLPCSFFYSKNTNTPKYIGAFSDKIFAITPNDIMPKYHVQCKDFIDRKEVEELKAVIKSKEYVYDLSSLYAKEPVFMISNLHEMKGMLTFQFMKDRLYNVFHNDDTGETFYTADLENDYIGYSNNFATNFTFSDEYGIYGILSENQIPRFVDEVVNNNRLNPHIDKYDKLLKVQNDSNPIIFYYKYKK